VHFTFISASPLCAIYCGKRTLCDNSFTNYKVRTLVILVLVIICSIYPGLGPFDGIDDLTDGIDEEFIRHFVLYDITY
jgi:hypothetical protein